MEAIKKIFSTYSKTPLILRILIGLIIGTALGLTVPGATWISIFGDIFVGALKAIAPVLVFVLVSSSLCQSRKKLGSQFRTVILFYLVSTLLAAIVAVALSFAFPQSIKLTSSAEADVIPSGLGEVLKNLLMGMVANPIESLYNGKYLGILFWSVLAGFALKAIASEPTKVFFHEMAEVVSLIVRWIINLAPFGIMGLVFTNISTNGLSIFTDYGSILLVLVGAMLIVALVVDPLIVFLALKTNPYPLVLRCLSQSGLTAFFTRSSAANIPVNMELCEKLGLDEEMYSVSIPLGATINMDGAAVTITVLTSAAANTVGVNVDIGSALLLSIVATFAACGASGVAGGSLLLIPMACSLFGISEDVAMQVVGVGFIIGVIQDSVETALNSSGDVMFASTAEYMEWKKNGKSLPEFLGGTTKTKI
ncbi:MAG: serine/threonine transporter SstT [Lachnospiraceae bacterium]|nr:serine/threonine transporter SstT [Lachnospiraceae bacterium]